MSAMSELFLYLIKQYGVSDRVVLAIVILITLFGIICLVHLGAEKGKDVNLFRLIRYKKGDSLNKYMLWTIVILSIIADIVVVKMYLVETVNKRL